MFLLREKENSITAVGHRAVRAGSRWTLFSNDDLTLGLAKEAFVTFGGNFSCSTIWHRLRQIESHAAAGSRRASREQKKRETARGGSGKERREREVVVGGVRARTR